MPGKRITNPPELSGFYILMRMTLLKIDVYVLPTTWSSWLAVLQLAIIKVQDGVLSWALTLLS